MAESAENEIMVVNVSGPTTTVLLNTALSFSDTAGWDPTLSVDWSKESPSPQCLMRIKRFVRFLKMRKGFILMSKYVETLY